MKRYYEKVDMRSRKAMVGFLAGHFRYNTMNSWNRSTSYANCVKVHRLDLPSEIMDKAFEMLDCSEIYDVFSRLLRDWADAHDWEWQAGFNGRSGGYLVLYHGGLDWKNARTAKCDHCGKLTWHKKATPCTSDYCNGTLQVLEKPVPQIFSQPGKPVDQDEDFSEWDIETLRERVKLVQEFDQLCDQIVMAFVSFCENYDVVDAEISVSKCIKVLEPAS
ncbi:hypothetical protein P4B35_02230 [Pontiellaceae bacterium B12227]|nr:hypothetical protein [Pontiellaceae bacterium B12227]